MEASHPPGRRAWDPSRLSGRERYHLLTSLVVPRPIAWVSTRSAAGHRNLAPFSYFMGVSATPLRVAVSIGERRGAAKDTLVNIRETGDFCINVVTERHLEAMNRTSGDHPPEVDEFEVAGLEAAEGRAVAAPCVADAPAVLECRLWREVDLESENVLVLGDVVAVHVAGELALEPETLRVAPEALRPVGRLGGEGYAMPGEVVRLARPRVE